MPYTPEEQTNRENWDDIAPVHLRSYGLESLRQGNSMLGKVEKRELGDLKGKKILHLQCHIGHDTLSLELEGGEVTGVDFSRESIRIAQDLGKELGLSTRFLLGNVLHLDQILDEKFDLIFTSSGVLCWIRDIALWGKNIADFLAIGGDFYIYEYHPFAYIFDETHPEALVPRYDYFSREPLYFSGEHADYADAAYISNLPTYEWLWPLSDIQNALISQGFEVEFLHEHPTSNYQMFPFLEDAGGGYWKLPDRIPAVPLMFSLKARRRAFTEDQGKGGLKK